MMKMPNAFYFVCPNRHRLGFYRKSYTSADNPDELLTSPCIFDSCVREGCPWQVITRLEGYTGFGGVKYFYTKVDIVTQ